MQETNTTSQERISQKLTPQSEKSGRKGVVIAISITAIALIAILAIVLVLVKPANDTATRNTIVTPDNVDEVLADMAASEKVEQGTYEVTMNTTWEFPTGDSASSNAYVENATTNNNDVYFSVVRSDNGETIFESPTIPVGSHIEDITLDSDLDAGEYACVLTYHLLDDSGKEKSKLDINLTIKVNE